MDGKRLTFEYVKSFFELNGCELLETKYINARTKMKYRCSCGNESTIVFYSFKAGNRCKKCGGNKISQKLFETRSPSQQQVEDYFRSQGCELLDRYVRSSQPMTYRCVCGNISKSNWNNFQRGRRCKECLRQRRSGPNNYQWIADREYKKEYQSFRDRCYKFLKMAIRATGQKKNSKTEQMLGYSIFEFHKHVKSHPNWEKVKNDRWHIDHIFPISAFIEHGITDISLINSLDNLQPLNYKDNISKSNKYNKESFYNWLNIKGIKYDRK